MTKDEYKEWFLTIDPLYIVFGNIDEQWIPHNDGTMWHLPGGCDEQFSPEEWFQLYENYRNNNKEYKSLYN